MTDSNNSDWDTPVGTTVAETALQLSAALSHCRSIEHAVRVGSDVARRIDALPPASLYSDIALVASLVDAYRQYVAACLVRRSSACATDSHRQQQQQHSVPALFNNSRGFV